MGLEELREGAQYIGNPASTKLRAGLPLFLVVGSREFPGGGDWGWKPLGRLLPGEAFFSSQIDPRDTSSARPRLEGGGASVPG